MDIPDYPFFFNGGGSQEPASDIREAANGIRQIYVALTSEGFSPAEALTLTQTILMSSAPGSGQ